MDKRFFALILSLVMVLCLLTACGAEETAQITTQTGEELPPVTEETWTKLMDLALTFRKHTAALDEMSTEEIPRELQDLLIKIDPRLSQIAGLRQDRCTEEAAQKACQDLETWISKLSPWVTLP